MENSAANSGLPSTELWASHNKMVMEPLDSNDPEVRAPAWHGSRWGQRPPRDGDRGQG